MYENYMIMFEELGSFLEMIEWRRELHRYPELACSEHRTQKFIAKILSENGISFREVASTGIIAEIIGENPDGEGGTIILRADIDALPLEEKNPNCSFSSQTLGVMHACGHDMHTAMLLGVLQTLNNHREFFSGRVVGFFEPSEECNPGGASMAFNERAFDRYTDIKACFAAHVDPAMPTGSFGFREGQYMASSDELRFYIKGVGGHAALRSQIKDPIKAGAYLSVAIYELPEKNMGCGRGITSIGQVEANGATNIVPNEIFMAGTMRTFDEECRTRIKDEIYLIAAGIDAEHGTSTEVTIGSGYPSIYNHPGLTRHVSQKAGELFGKDNIYDLDLRFTSDDFGYFSQRYPSLFYRVGVGGRNKFFEQGEAGNVHSSTFNPDEKALSYGCILMTLITIETLNSGFGE